MSFYDIVSSILTVLGHVVLIYRIVYELQSGTKKSMKEKLCTKWVIFTIFLKIEYWILAVMQILPLGALALLIIKLLLFLPQNPISHKIYKTIQKRLDRIKMDQYHSQLGVYISFICKHAVILMFRGIKKIAEYVNSNDIEQAENHILDLIKIFQYKKAAVNMRSQAFRSQINKQLNDTQFNVSQSEDEIVPNLNAEKKNKSHIGNRMSMILADLQEDDGSTLKITADIMIVKPNKALGQKAKYEQSTLQFYTQTKKLTITNKNKAEEHGTLKTIKWITKDMIHLEVIFQQGRSKIVKLKQKSDVAKWVQPICESIEDSQK